MSNNYKTVTFRDKHGNRMFFPSWCIFEDGDNIHTVDELLFMKMQYESVLDFVFDDEMTEFSEENFALVEGEIFSSALKHGSATVFVFEGPAFDDAMKSLKKKIN